MDPIPQSDERTALLSGRTPSPGYEGDASASSSSSSPTTPVPETRKLLTPRVVHRLYLSHFLSTWNSRVFEFGAVLYLAKIFPGTLMPMSIYALTRGLSALVLASAVGRYIDQNDRLKVVRASIVYQRLAVAASCALFYIMSANLPLFSGRHGHTEMLVLVSILACVEKIYFIINMVSVEKDWVVVLAKDDLMGLANLNAQIRRIDLLCKLLGPLSIALIDSVSTDAAILVNLGMNVASVVAEYFAIARIYYEVPELQETKTPKLEDDDDESDDEGKPSIFVRVWHVVSSNVRTSVSDFAFYFSHPAMLPSAAGALLYLTVLSFAAQMVTYLVSSGYTTAQVAVARTLSVTLEVLATWVGPWMIGRLGPLRAGLWLSQFQVIPLIAGLVVFWVFPQGTLASASGLVVGTILSRLGLRGFDLCTQIIVQEEVEAENRGKFSSVEAALQNAFDIISYISTVIFFLPSEFRWPSLLSVASVTMASILYTMFVMKRRGELHPAEHHEQPSRGKRSASTDEED